MIFPDTVLQDLRHGIRTLSRNPWSTVITVLSLALGIGVNTAFFTAYHAFVARRLDARSPAEMVNIALIRDSGAAGFAFSYPDYEAYRDSVRALQGLVAFRPARVTVSNAGGMIDQRTAMSGSALGRLGLMTAGASNTEFAQVFIVSENYFAVLGVSAIRGRTFENPTVPGPVPGPVSAAPYVLISENYWQRRFGGDSEIVGKTLQLNGVPVTVIGVTPHDFAGTSVGAPAFWIPLGLEPQINADSNWLRERENGHYRMFGRLAPGVTVAQAKAQTALAADRIRKLHALGAEGAKPATVLVWPGSPFPLPLNYYPGLTDAVLLLMAGAAMILAVAAANAGSLQLARSRSREVELHTRLSLGATRARLIRQLLTENALVGILAGVFAMFVSWGFLKLAVKAFVDGMPVEFMAFVFDVSPSLPVFGYVLLVSLIAGFLAGLSPAMQSPKSALTSTARASTVSGRGRRLQDLLVAVQVTFSLVLMITGSMFMRGSMNILHMETGYDSKHVVQLDFQFPPALGYNDSRKLTRVQELRVQLSALPGVTGITSARPPGGSFRTAAAAVEAKRGFTASEQHVLYYTYVEADYWDTLGISLFAGHAFQRQNRNERCVVLSESAAKQIWPGENPIGQSLRLGRLDEGMHTRIELVADGPAYQVVGVARDTRGGEFDGSDTKQIYLPLSGARVADRPLLIRTQVNAAQVIRAVERVAASIDPQMIATATTLEDGLRRSPPFGVSVIAAAIASGIGLLGLLLAVAGIFGTVSHIVTLRTRELGIRMALGAQRRDVLRLVLGQSSRPVLGGLLAGMVIAAGVVYVLRGILYGVNGVDAVVFVLLSILFLVVALLAAYPPGRRAMRIDPAVALRYE